MFSMIPLPYKLLAGIALIIGVFLFGYMKGSANAEAELAWYAARASEQIAELEKKNSVISTQVVTEYVDRVNTIKEKEYVYLERAKNDVPDTTILSNGWVLVHNASTQGSDADAAGAADASPSGIAANQALATVVANYSNCKANAEQLRSLQEWVVKSKEAVDKANAEAEKKK